jgi:hypothetical protein
MGPPSVWGSVELITTRFAIYFSLSSFTNYSLMLSGVFGDNECSLFDRLREINVWAALSPDEQTK